MASTNQIQSVANYVAKCGLRFPRQGFSSYSHVGATIADTVLQAGLSYTHVVRPRVETILSRFPNSRTTSAILDLLETYSAARLLQWRHHEKPRRFRSLVNLLYISCVETEAELREWLKSPRNVERISQVHGIGPKSIDYLKGLVGISTIAVDRHLKTFMQRAGVELREYKAVKDVLEATADSLNVPRSDLDYAIWQYMSGGGRKEAVS